MRPLALPYSAAALVAGMALSACGGSGVAPNGAGSLPQTMPNVMMPAAHHTPPPKSGCHAPQTGWVFGGRCARAEISSSGGNALIPKYKGYVVHGKFGANDAPTGSTTVFIVRDATGNGDISGTNASGASFPPLTSGTAFLYLAVTNTSSATITFNQTPAIIITNVGHGGFPGTACGLYALEPSGWTPTGVTATPKSVGKRGMSRLTFPATTLSTTVPFAPGASYFGFSC